MEQPEARFHLDLGVERMAAIPFERHGANALDFATRQVGDSAMLCGPQRFCAICAPIRLRRGNSVRRSTVTNPHYG